MQELFSYQDKIFGTITDDWYRSAFKNIEWSQRLFGIKGLRGVGKTTMMLQYLKYHFKNREKALYISADNPWFYDNSLYGLISDFDKMGGELLVIDEIHKYSNWAKELKAGYDAHPEMRFIFSASSAFDIFTAEADLSRRATITMLTGLSFREYLAFKKGINVSAYTLDELLTDGKQISEEFLALGKPIPLFKEYLKSGYFPFLKNDSEEATKQKLASIVHAVLESDLAYVQDYSPSNVQKIKKLLGVIAGTAPFTPNISTIANKLNVGRNTIYNYLKHLEDAHILNLIHKVGRGVSVLQKPDKVYFENTNIAQALNINAQIGALRETFFVNQLRNAGHTVNLAEKADFIIDDKAIVEVGGKNKTSKQIKGIKDGFIAKDDIEYGHQHIIPLWMFGLLY